MIVRAIDDINLKIIRDPSGTHIAGHFILWPNSVRRDINLHFAPPPDARIRNARFNGQDLDQKERG